jgi:hypothetical protein
MGTDAEAVTKNAVAEVWYDTTTPCAMTALYESCKRTVWFLRLME